METSRGTDGGVGMATVTLAFTKHHSTTIKNTRQHPPHPLLSLTVFDRDPQESSTDIPYHRTQERASLHPTKATSTEAGTQQNSRIRDTVSGHREVQQLLAMQMLSSLGRKGTRIHP